MVTYSIARDAVAVPENGTGVLVPLNTPRDGGDDSLIITAITLLDRKWPHLRREGEVLVRAHVGRSDDRRFTDLDDDALVDRVRSELVHLFGRFDSPRDVMVQRWPVGLPQYRVHHDRLVAAARAAARGPTSSIQTMPTARSTTASAMSSG